MLYSRLAMKNPERLAAFCLLRSVRRALKKNCTGYLVTYTWTIFATYAALGYGKSLPCIKYQSQIYRWRVTVFHTLASQMEKFSHATSCCSYADYFYSAVIQLIASACDCRSHLLLFQASSGADNSITGQVGNSTQFFKGFYSLLWDTHCHLYRYPN